MTDIKVGDRDRFAPASTAKRWWTIRARSGRYVLATLPVPFKSRGTCYFTIADLETCKRTYGGGISDDLLLKLELVYGGDVSALLPEDYATALREALNIDISEIEVRE